jgi:hypothetical protein
MIGLRNFVSCIWLCLECSVILLILGTIVWGLPINLWCCGRGVGNEILDSRVGGTVRVTRMKHDRMLHWNSTFTAPTWAVTLTHPSMRSRGGVFSYTAWSTASPHHTTAATLRWRPFTHTASSVKTKSRNINKAISRKLIQFVSTTSTAFATLQHKLNSQATLLPLTRFSSPFSALTTIQSYSITQASHSLSLINIYTPSPGTGVKVLWCCDSRSFGNSGPPRTLTPLTFWRLNVF